MDELVSEIQTQASQALLHHFGQEARPNQNPILELIACLVADEEGTIDATLPLPITSDQWVYWNALVLEQEAKLTQVMNEILIREQLTIPKSLEALRSWAACLVLETLDWLQLT